MRRFEFSAGGSDKFWEITLSGDSFTVRYGRIGTNGQTQTKKFDSEQKAEREYNKVIEEKLHKGYVEIVPSGTASAVTPRAARTGENLRAQLIKAGVDVTTFRKLATSGEEDDEDDEESSGRKRDLGNAFYCLELPALKAVEIWETARSLVDATGFYPIISEDTDQLFEYLEFEDDFSPADNIKRALAVRVNEFFDELKTQVDSERSLLGPWPEHPPQEMEQYYVVSSVGADGVLPLIFCPTNSAWQVCCVLNWGNSNDNIDPFCHAALHKSWGTEYGAEIVCVTMSIMEFKVSKPPTTKDAAMKLAHEQFSYCPDIVDQGVQTISNLGAGLINSPKWYFWWD